MKKILAIITIAACVVANPITTDAEAPARDLVYHCEGETAVQIKATSPITVEESNVLEAQSQTGRWAPTATPDHVKQERIDDEISEHFDLFCDVIYAEAGNQGDHGMRLVADVIINRMRSGEAFDDTLYGVLTAKNQFACVSDGGAKKWRGHEKKQVRKIAQEELEHVTDSTIFYFRTGHYGTGVPAYKYKDHYFSRRK